MRRFRCAAALLGGLVLVACSASAARPDSRAFQGIAADRETSPRVRASLVVDAPAGTTLANLDLVETASGRVVRSYDLDMTKQLHLILIRDDFGSFLHVHPALDAAGHFHIALRLPRDSGYHVYADGEPTGIGNRVFRFDVRFGPKSESPVAPIPARRTARTGPYAVTLSTLEISTGHATRVAVRVTKQGAPAADLHPYLGGVAHAIFINTNDLSYIHVHPAAARSAHATHASGMMNMNGTSMAAGTSVVPADAALTVTAPTAGTYRLWYEFAGGNSNYVASFVIVAR